MKHLRAFALVIAMAGAPVAAAAQSADVGCASVARPPSAPRPSAFGGLLAAARQSGLTDALGAQLGQGRNAQVAGAAGALLSGDPASAVGAAMNGRDPRTAQLAGATAGTVLEMARAAKARSGQASGCPPSEPTAGGETWR